MNPLKLLREKWSPPVEPETSFKGQTVLVTGANTGLGLEAAKKVAALGADRLIITTRSQSKGDKTKGDIHQWLASTKSPTVTEIIPLVLDMSGSNGVNSFMKQLRATTLKLDAVILNAGINQPFYRTSSENFEETIQVNTISTVYLSTLLLPLLISTAKSSSKQTRLTFSSSRNATMNASFPTSSTIISSQKPLMTMSEADQFPSGFMGGAIQYGRSKLLLEYAVRRMVRLPVVADENGKPYVVINSVCPGVTRTDLARSYEHWIARFASTVFLAVFAKSAADGANAYLQALTSGDDSAGQMWAAGRYVESWGALTSEAGQNLGDKVWEEIKELMLSWDNSVDDLLKLRK